MFGLEKRQPVLTVLIVYGQYLESATDVYAEEEKFGGSYTALGLEVAVNPGARGRSSPDTKYSYSSKNIILRIFSNNF